MASSHQVPAGSWGPGRPCIAIDKTLLEASPLGYSVWDNAWHIVVCAASATHALQVPAHKAHYHPRNMTERAAPGVLWQMSVGGNCRSGRWLWRKPMAARCSTADASGRTTVKTTVQQVSGPAHPRRHTEPLPPVPLFTTCNKCRACLRAAQGGCYRAGAAGYHRTVRFLALEAERAEGAALAVPLRPSRSNGCAAGTCTYVCST